MGAMRETVAEGQPPFARTDLVVLAQVGDRGGEEAVEVEPSLLGELENHGSGGDHLGDRGKIEPVLASEALALRNDGGVSVEHHRALAARRHQPKRCAGNAALAQKGLHHVEGAGGDLLDHAPNTGCGDCTSSSGSRAVTRAMNGRNSSAARLRAPESRKNPS